MTVERPRWREMRDDEVLQPGTLPVEVDGKRMVCDDLEDETDDESGNDRGGEATGEAVADTAEAAVDTEAAKATALREAAARLARLPKVERELQEKAERERLDVPAAAMRAALKEADAAAAADTDPEIIAEDEPKDTMDEAVQRLAGMDGLDYAAALGEASATFKIPRSVLEQFVQRKRERRRPAQSPGATGLTLQRGFRLDETGLWFQPLPSAQNPEPAPVFVCGPFEILGEARDLESRSWGVVIRWLDHDRRPHVWSCPQRLVHLDGNAIAAELADAGLTCGTSKRAHELLKQFLGALRTSQRLQSAERAGWHVTASHAGIVTHDAAVIIPEEKS